MRIIQVEILARHLAGRDILMPVPVPLMRVRTLSSSVWGEHQPKSPDKHDRVHNNIC
jgi:hypothetical protein